MSVRQSVSDFTICSDKKETESRVTGGALQADISSVQQDLCNKVFICCVNGACVYTPALHNKSLSLCWRCFTVKQSHKLFVMTVLI